jgi:hypothetical protein
MALAAPKSALPAAQQARRDAILARTAGEQAPAPVETNSPEPAAVAQAPAPAPQVREQAPPAADPVPERQEGDMVQLSRAELEELRATQSRANQLELAAEVSALEAAEARQRLTDLETSRNEEATVITAPDLGFTRDSFEITSAERQEFEESEGFVVKVVRREIAAAFDKFNALIAPQLATVAKQAATVSTRVERTVQKNFIDKVQEAAPDCNALVGHANFKRFLDGIVPMTNLTYNQALATAHRDENLKAVLDIFQAFRTANSIAKPDKTGYNGGAAVRTLAEPAPVVQGKRYTLAERKKWSEDLIKGRVSKEAFEEFKKKFDEAVKDNRVDA